MSSILYEDENPHNTTVIEMTNKYYEALDKVKGIMNTLSEADTKLANISIANLDDINNEKIVAQEKKCKALKKVYKITLENLQCISSFLELTTGQSIDNFINGKKADQGNKKGTKLTDTENSAKLTFLESSPVLAARKQMERVGLQLPSSPAKLFIEPNESFINQGTNGRPIPFKDLPNFGKKQGQIENIFELLLKYEQIVSCYDYNVEVEWRRSIRLCFDYDTIRIIDPPLKECQTWDD
ncbi:hypothetical protein H4219_006316, partial [Mycoemilia scoparia]